LFEQAEALYREVSGDLGVANVALRLAILDWQTAGEKLPQILAAFQRFGSRVSESSCLLSMGNYHLRQIEPQAAIPFFLAAQEIGQNMGDLSTEAGALVRRGQALRLMGRQAEGQKLIEEGFNMWMLSVTKRDLTFDGWGFFRDSLLAADKNQAGVLRGKARSAWLLIGRHDLIRDCVDLANALEAVSPR
jgi:hypothetical protein